ncbi:MAG: hypothetical protein ACRD3W_14115 [Terriglobales bacterium]
MHQPEQSQSSVENTPELKPITITIPTFGRFQFVRKLQAALSILAPRLR